MHTLAASSAGWIALSPSVAWRARFEHLTLLLVWCSCLTGLVYLAAAPSAGLDWEQRPGARVARVSPPEPGRTGFVRIPGPDAGVTFTNLLGDERSALNRNLLSGSGVAAGDFDGDGWCDLYFCGLDSDNRLFRNLGGWKFADVTREADVGCAGQDSTGASFADVDGDGDLDLLVTALGNGLRVFQNTGLGRFTETTTQAGVASKTGGMSLALADIDGDGDLDLYVANYFPTTIRDRPSTQLRIQTIAGRPVVTAVDGRPTTEPDLTNRFELGPGGDVIEHSQPSDLFLNDGRGHFTRASFTEGRFLDEDGHPLRNPPRDWSLTVRFYDFNGDGAPDIYVCNDLVSEDRIWINDGQGHFRAPPRLALRHTSTFSMGIDFGDLNRDGHVDFFVVDMVSRDLRNRKVQIAGLSPNFPIPGVFDDRLQYFQNTLQIGRGDGTFAEAAHYAGLEATEWSWQPVFLDVDLDGYEDILIPNGMLRDFQNADMGHRIEQAVASRRVPAQELVRMFQEFPGLILPNLCYRNLGAFRFEEVGEAWGFATPGVSQGLALADLDNDGDLDVAINNLTTAAALYRNDSSAPRLAVRLKGRPPNTAAIGSRLRLLGGPVDQTQEMVAGGRYLSSDQAIRCFAAGVTNRPLTLEITWRNGRRSILRDLPANSICEVEEEKSAAESPSTPSPSPIPLFQDVSDRLSHTHHETPVDEFTSHQFLLPRLYSRLGPGVSWIDVDQDGDDDLVVGTGAGGKLALFNSQGNGQFQAIEQSPLDTVVERDITTVLGVPSSSGVLILAGSANYEDRLERGAVARTFDLPGRHVLDQLPGQKSSTGPLSMADVDGDGDLDLFVGARVTAGRYPEPASSFLFLSDGGRFNLDQRNINVFVDVGLVSSSVFSDLDGDADPDLVLACEWGPLRIYRNDQGKFTEVTSPWGFSGFKGWWNGVTTADLDGDGRMDIIASNWGLNSHYRASQQFPRKIYYGSFLDPASVDLVEACHDPALGFDVPHRDLRIMAMGLPFLRESYADHQTYSRASVQGILGRFAGQAKQVEATTLASMAFLNRGERWQPVELPPDAQLTTAFALVAADFDGDGHDDLFLSQNFFDNEPFASRQDAGRGLLLRGDGQGGMRPVSGQESGLLIYGQQRGAATADFDQDGRPDLVVAQNNAQTRLFRNTQAKPGLSVRLRGTAGNPWAVGAALRVVYQDGGMGPIREIRSGAGYWSQDSFTQILGLRSAPAGLWIRWPDGKTTRTDIRPDTIRYLIEAPKS